MSCMGRAEAFGLWLYNACFIDRRRLVVSTVRLRLGYNVPMLTSIVVAIGLIVLKGTAGDFVSWSENLTTFGINTMLGFALLMVLRKVADGLFLPGTTLAHEIATDRNLNAAWIEGVVAVSVAGLVFVLL